MSRVESTQATWYNDSVAEDVPPYVRLASGTLIEEDGSLNVEIHLAGCFPRGKVCCRVELFCGGDTSVEILITGAYPFRGAAGSIRSRLREGVRACNRQRARVERIYTIVDPELPRKPSTYAVCDGIHQRMPPGSVAPRKKSGELRILSTDLVSGASDAVAAQLKWSRPSGARITVRPLNIAPGGRLRVAASGFAPNGSVEVCLDDAVLLTSASDARGRVHTFCQLPRVDPGWYFLTAREPGAGFDFSAIYVTKNRERRSKAIF